MGQGWSWHPGREQVTQRKRRGTGKGQRERTEWRRAGEALGRRELPCDLQHLSEVLTLGDQCVPGLKGSFFPGCPRRVPSSAQTLQWGGAGGELGHRGGHRVSDSQGQALPFLRAPLPSVLPGTPFTPGTLSSARSLGQPDSPPLGTPHPRLSCASAILPDSSPGPNSLFQHAPLSPAVPGQPGLCSHQRLPPGIPLLPTPS